MELTDEELVTGSRAYANIVEAFGQTKARNLLLLMRVLEDNFDLELAKRWFELIGEDYLGTEAWQTYNNQESDSHA